MPRTQNYGQARCFRHYPFLFRRAVKTSIARFQFTFHPSDLFAKPLVCFVLGHPDPQEAREQIEAELRRYATTGLHDVKALQGRDGYRLRIGSYRVIFDEDATTILAIYIGRRATTTYKRN